MALFRALVIAVMVAAMVAVPLLAPGGWSAGGVRAYAAPAAAPLADDDDDDDGDLSNDDDDDDDWDDDDDNGRNDNADDDDDDDGGNDNDDNDEGDDNDNQDDGVAPAIVNVPAAPAAASAPACSTPGQETVFQSDDGRVAVRVFGNLPQSVKLTVGMPIDPAAVPPAPGQVVGGLLFQIVAESCDGTPIPSLASEVNLGVRYNDADAAGLNEQSFTLARLDTGANQWRAVEKQATDPPANYTSATIREMGYYVLYQRS